MIKDIIKNVVIWGHKPHTHTHSYIHSSYYKTFQAMGFNTVWFYKKFDYLRLPKFNENTLFFTEGQVDENIPLIKNAFYILHHCKPEKYLNAGCKVLNLCNYVKYCEDGVSFNYKDQGNTVEKVKDFLFYDEKAKAIYQPWATDLLPEEINTDDFCQYDSEKKDINYVGSIWAENITEIREFYKACCDNGKKFINYKGVSDNINKKLVRNSYIAPDLRGKWHRECGYIPCRIFKNLSYGKITGTNSKHVYDLFHGMIAYSKSPYGLFKACEKKEKETNSVDMKKTMQYIKDKHTFINRVENILEMLERI